MYISVLQRNKKTRKSIPFKRKVVEVFRAEIADAPDIERHLHISPTELRRLNRCGAARAVFQASISSLSVSLSLLQIHEEAQPGRLC